MKSLILILTMMLSIGANASFEENSRRYLSAQEIFATLSMYFDLPPASPNCIAVSPGNSSVVGVNSPKSGEPVTPVPGQGTIVLIVGCVAQSLSASTSAYRLTPLVGAEFARKYEMDRGNLDVMKMPWNQIPEVDRLHVVENLVFTLLGSDTIITDFGFINDCNDFRQRLHEHSLKRPGDTVLDAVRFLSVNLVIRDEFLSY